MTVIDDIKRKKDSIKTGVINLVQRTRVCKKGKDENASDNWRPAEPDEEGDQNNPEVPRRYTPEKFNTEATKEGESLNSGNTSGKCHGGEQTDSFNFYKSGCIDVPLSESKHSGTDRLDGVSREVQKNTGSDIKPGTSFKKERQKCLSDSRCLKISESEARNGGKHICKRGTHNATNGDMKLDEDRRYNTDDKSDVPEQLQPSAGERFQIPPGQTFLTNRRPKLDKFPPSSLPSLQSKRKGLQKFHDEERARQSEHRQKKLNISYQDVCNRQDETREEFMNKYRYAQLKPGTMCQPMTADVWGRAGKRRGRNNQLPDMQECCTQEDNSKLERDLSRMNAFRGASPRSMCTMSPQVGSERDPLEGLDDLLADIENSLGEREQAESKPEDHDDSFWNILAPCSDVSQGMEVKKHRKAGRRSRTKQEELQRDVAIMDKLLDELGRPC